MAIFTSAAFEEHCYVCFDCFSACVEHDAKLRAWIDLGACSEGFVFISEVPANHYTASHACDCCQRSVLTRKLQAFTSFTPENFKVIPADALEAIKQRQI